MAYVLGYRCQGATVFKQRMKSVPSFSFESPELILFWLMTGSLLLGMLPSGFVWLCGSHPKALSSHWHSLWGQENFSATFLCSTNSERLKNPAQHFLQMWDFCWASLLQLCPLPLHHHSPGISLEHPVPCGCLPCSSTKLMCCSFACKFLDMVHAFGYWEESWWRASSPPPVPGVSVPGISCFLCYLMGHS